MKKLIVLVLIIGSLTGAYAFGFHQGRSGVVGDLNHDGVVDILDLSLLSSHYTQR